MIYDRILVLSTAQAVTTTAYSEDEINLGAGDLDIGEGTVLVLHVLLSVAFATSANTLTIQLVDGAATAPTTVRETLLPATATSALLSPAQLIRQSLPLDVDQYFRLYYVASAALSDGVLNAFVSLDNG